LSISPAEAQASPISWRNIISASLLIGGTSIGAGMLGIPLVSAQAGFLPAFLITFLVWIFMYSTGILFLEATLWMHKGANVLSMAERFLGKRGKIISGSIFIFLYYCLMVAYFAAGAPMLGDVFSHILGIPIVGWHSYAFFGVVFALIIAAGLKVIDRLNYILMIGLFIAYFALIGAGSEMVSLNRLIPSSWAKMTLAAPMLFSAFGYHNIVPPLTFHYKGNAKEMRWAILIGSLIPFVVYTIWQWMIIGGVPQDNIFTAFQEGAAITQTLESMTGYRWLPKISQVFGLFAIITSMLGVAYSVFDFLNDGIKIKNSTYKKVFLCLLTFVPPFVMTMINPSIFVIAIGIAGGFGEAFLNGLLPIWLVWVGRYIHKLESKPLLNGGKKTLVFLFLFGAFVFFLEIYILVFGQH